jgi:Trk K+ transport system NAD-binding subunit
VVICENAASNLFVKHIQGEPDVHIISGDARVAEVLQQAGIATAYSIAAVTSNNLTNIQIGLEARRLRPDIDVVLRVFSAMLAEQLDTIFGMYTAFSTSALAAPTLAAAAVEPGISYALNIGGRLLSTTELPVQSGDMFVGKTVEQVYAAHKAIVVALRRGQQRTIMPDPHVDLQVGDVVEVLAEIGMVAQLSAQWRKGARRKSRKLMK